MSVPAPTPVDLVVARVRAGIARGLALAGPAARRWAGHGSPGEYRSPFPARLLIGRAVIVILALLWLAAGFSGLDATRTIVRTIGHDTAPSVAAAEAIYTDVATANADYALAMLSQESAGGDFLLAMRSRLGAVHAPIVDAAANITYGEEERQPIAAVLQGLGDYEEFVGRSIASAGDARHDLAFQADEILHRTVLPGAVTLGSVNADHLTKDYEGYLGRWPVWWLATAGLLLTGGLVVVQIDVARTARRVVNPGLALATLAVIAATAFVASSLLSARADLHVAKAEAFDSIYALSSAQAVAADADAAQSLFLLAQGDTGRAQTFDRAFDARARRLLSEASPWVLGSSPAEQRRAGYLGQELANVTFPGEAAAAREAVQAWDAVRMADAVLHIGLQRDTAAARDSVSVDRPGDMRHAFNRFDAALAKVLAINQDAFTASIAAAEADDAPLGAVLVAGFVLAVAAAWFGIRQRLDEYRF